MPTVPLVDDVEEHVGRVGAVGETADFDDWQHVLVHEGFEAADEERKYPRCVAGGGRCPPEDCGGVHGYAEFLQVVADPEHEEHESTLRWPGAGLTRKAFDPAAVRVRRSKEALEEGIRAAAMSLAQRLRRWHRRHRRREGHATTVHRAGKAPCLLRRISSLSTIRKGTRRCSRRYVGAAHSMSAWSIWTPATT
jgi:hypothetical protein